MTWSILLTGSLPRPFCPPYTARTLPGALARRTPRTYRTISRLLRFTSLHWIVAYILRAERTVIPVCLLYALCYLVRLDRQLVYNYFTLFYTLIPATHPWLSGCICSCTSPQFTDSAGREITPCARRSPTPLPRVFTPPLAYLRLCHRFSLPSAALYGHGSVPVLYYGHAVQSILFLFVVCTWPLLRRLHI